MSQELQSSHTRRGVFWWGSRILLSLAALLLLVLAITLVAGAKADLKAQYPPPGAMVEVGGYRLHLNCARNGSPTVIMESGLDDSSLLWALLRPERVKTTLVCVYDRASLD